MNRKNFVVVLGSFALPVLLVSGAFAVNKIPLKPDSANDAPCTIFGSPSNGMSCGKTTAPTGKVDIQGDLNVSGIVSGTIDSTKISANSIDTAKIAADAVTNAKIINAAVDSNKLASSAVTNAKIASGSVDTSKINAIAHTGAALCELGSGQFGHCSNASAVTCTCQ